MAMYLDLGGKQRRKTRSVVAQQGTKAEAQDIIVQDEPDVVEEPEKCQRWETWKDWMHTGYRAGHTLEYTSHPAPWIEHRRLLETSLPAFREP